MTDLSPVAQAVWDAICATTEPDCSTEHLAAAAIRAAADLVVPEHREYYPATLDERYRKVSAFDVRNKFLAIAAELEAQ